MEVVVKGFSMCNNRKGWSSIKHPPPVKVLLLIMEELIASSTVVANSLENETVKRAVVVLA